MKKLSNTEAELKKRVAYKKGVYHYLRKVASAKKINLWKYSLNWKNFLFYGKVMLCSPDI